MRILLLEDDNDIAGGLQQGLKHYGFAVDWLSSGEQGKTAPQLVEYDAAILDLGLPEVDGLDVLSYWREQDYDLPVLILSARDALSDRVLGLNRGADDYLSKPFALDEVIARLHAIVRRQHGSRSNCLQYGALSLDSSAKTATLNDAPLALGQKELLLLELLLTQKNRILSRAQIEDKLYGWDSEIDSNTIEVHIHSLRKKLGKTFIKTRRGLGYQLGDKP